MANEGAHVVASGINEALLEDLPGLSGNIEIIRLDVRDPEAISAVAANFNQVDILFNCSGFVHHGSIMEAGDEEWDFAFDLNVKLMFHMIRAFLPFMLENGGGSIVNMSSAASSIKGVPNQFLICHDQGRSDWLDQTCCGRLCDERHSLQRHLSRYNSVVFTGGSH